MKTEHISISSAAKELGVSYLHLRTAINAGTVPFVRIGRRIRIDVEDLLDCHSYIIDACIHPKGVSVPIHLSSHVIPPSEDVNIEGAFTARQVAEIFDSSESTIYSWIRLNLLTDCKQEGSQWQIPVKSVDALLWGASANKGRSLGRKLHWTREVQNRFETAVLSLHPRVEPSVEALLPTDQTIPEIDSAPSINFPEREVLTESLRDLNKQFEALHNPPIPVPSTLSWSISPYVLPLPLTQHSLMSFEQVMDFLHVDRDALLRMIKEDAIPHFAYLTGVYGFETVQIQSWIESKIASWTERKVPSSRRPKEIQPLLPRRIHPDEID